MDRNERDSHTHTIAGITLHTLLLTDYTIPRRKETNIMGFHWRFSGVTPAVAETLLDFRGGEYLLPGW